MARTLYCRRCTKGTEVLGGFVPEICPFCHGIADDTEDGALWTTQQPIDGWDLNHMDKRFLKSLRIEPS